MPAFDSARGDRGLVIDRRTGAPIPNVARGDDAAGWCDVYVRGEDGHCVLDWTRRELKTERRRGPILWLPFRDGTGDDDDAR